MSQQSLALAIFANMTQQPQDLSYLDYGSSANRSPGTRQNYGGAFGSGLSLPRQTQRPFDAPLGSSALYGGERPGAGFPRGMDNMASAGGMPSYLLDNNQQQPWNYSAGGVATVNGAVNGPSRQRSVNRRAALPQVSNPLGTSDDSVLTHPAELDRSNHGPRRQHARLPRRPQRKPHVQRWTTSRPPGHACLPFRSSTLAFRR